MMSPFLPTSYNTIDRVLGGKGNIAPMPRTEEVTDLDVSNNDGPSRTYPIIIEGYMNAPTWERYLATISQEVAKPVPVLEKLDGSTVDEEIVRYAGSLGK